MDTIDRINVILKERGMSGADLSRQIGLSTAVYSQWNTKKTKPSNKNIAKVAEALNVPVSDLTGEVQKEKPAPKDGSGPDKNVIKIAGRDGSFVERKLTDEQMAALRLIIDQLPNAEDL